MVVRLILSERPITGYAIKCFMYRLEIAMCIKGLFWYHMRPKIKVDFREFLFKCCFIRTIVKVLRTGNYLTFTATLVLKMENGRPKG